MNVAWPARCTRMYWRREIVSIQWWESEEGQRETYFDAGDGRFFVVDDDGVNVAAEDGRDGETVLVVSRLAKIDDTALDA
jgi:hypothetical protein